LNKREENRVRSLEEVGREGESVEVREKEVGMNLGGEREDLALITGEIRNLAKEIIPLEANDTPHIKENHREASGASPESPIPQVPSIQVVSLILPSHFVLVQLISQSQPGSERIGRILGSPGKSQEGLLGFILIGTKSSVLVSHTGVSIARYPEFCGKGDEDIEQHWFLCEAIWISRGTPDVNKLVEFQTTLRGCALKWYMNIIKPGVSRMQGQAFTLDQV
jgi:hypothetical protein